MRTAMFLAVASLTCAAAWAADPVAPAPPGEAAYHYWMHPKLGLVKVDRRTHGLVTAQRSAYAKRRGAAAAGTQS